MQIYYNRYNKDSNVFKKLRFFPKRGSQSAEMNELQEILLENSKDIFDTLFSNGSIISGGNILRSGPTLSIEYGLVYYNGLTIKVPARSITLAEGSTDSLGVLITESVETSSTNSSLKNPAVGTLLFNTQGADRLKVEGQWSKLSEASSLATGQYFFPRYSIVDGSINESEVYGTTDLNSTQSLLENYDYNSNGNYVVKGLNVYYEKDLPLENAYLLNIKDGLANVIGKQYTFPFSNKVKIDYALITNTVIGEPSEYSTSKTTYALRRFPISTISQILASKLVTNQNIVHGSFTGSSDPLLNTPVASVISVIQGAKTYVRDVDFTVVGDSIDWSLAGAEPAPGSTYQVTYTQISTNITYTINSSRTSIEVPLSNGIQNGSSLFITYSYYLPRKDRLVVNPEGQITVLKGYPSDAPVALSSERSLSLAIVEVAFGFTPTITLDTFQAFKMSDILTLKNRIDLIEFNIAQLSLAEDVRSTDPTTNKINLFVDSFFDDDLRDFGISQNAVIIDQTLISNVDFTQHVIKQGEDIILDHSASYPIAQEAFTKSRQVNEFIWQDAPPGFISASPSVYRWVASQVINDVWASSASTRWPSQIPSSASWLNSRTAQATTSSESFIEIDAVIPNISIKITGSLWNANEPIDVYYDSSLIATINALPNGHVDYDLPIPVGARSGTVQIRLEGQVTGIEASTTFTAVPLSRIITRRNQLWTINTDPVAQTFTLRSPVFLKSVELIFEVNSPNFVDVFITRTQVGIPDRTQAIAIKRLYPQEILINQWQEFEFDQPVYLEGGVEYAIVVECTDALAKVRVAELGEYAANVGKWQSSQPLDVGVLLNSANGSTWSPIQKEDLTFKLKTCLFQSSQTISLGTLEVTNCTDLLLLAGIDTPQSTSLRFEAILIDRSSETHSIFPYSILEIAEYTGTVEIIAYLSTSSNNLSPAIEGTVILAQGSVQLPSSYISRSINLSSTSSKLTAILDVNEPSPSSIILYYKNSIGNWIQLSRNPLLSQQIGNGWVRLTYEENISSLSSTAVKIELTSSNNQSRPMAKNLRVFTS